MNTEININTEILIGEVMNAAGMENVIIPNKVQKSRLGIIYQHASHHRRGFATASPTPDPTPTA